MGTALPGGDGGGSIITACVRRSALILVCGEAAV